MPKASYPTLYTTLPSIFRHIHIALVLPWSFKHIRSSSENNPWQTGAVQFQSLDGLTFMNWGVAKRTVATKHICIAGVGWNVLCTPPSKPLQEELGPKMKNRKVNISTYGLYHNYVNHFSTWSIQRRYYETVDNNVHQNICISKEYWLDRFLWHSNTFSYNSFKLGRNIGLIVNL